MGSFLIEFIALFIMWINIGSYRLNDSKIEIFSKRWFIQLILLIFSISLIKYSK